MRSITKTFLLLTIIGIATVGTWQWLQHETSPALLTPEVGIIAFQEQHAPHVSAVIADSSEWARRQAARKNAHNVGSVARAFKDASDCLLYHSARHELKAFLNDERLDDISNETLATLENIDATSKMYLSIVRKTEAFCIGSDRDSLAQVYADAILTAALLGDADAESCFVIGSISPLEITSATSLEFFENRYLKYAPTFIQNALERSDPYVAGNALYRYIASDGVHPSRLDDLPKADPYLTWRAARLASLRVLPEQRTRLEGDLARLEKQNILQLDDIKRADAWARAAYEREFAGQAPIDLDAQAPCYSSPYFARQASGPGGHP